MAYFSGSSDFAGRSCHDTGSQSKSVQGYCMDRYGNTQLYAGILIGSLIVCALVKTGYADCICFY